MTTEKPSVEISTEDIRRALHGLRLFYAAIDLAREDSAASKELFEKSKNLTSKAEEASRIIGAYCLKHGFDARFVGVDMARKICQSNQSKELP